jgi:hypothetical protein
MMTMRNKVLQDSTAISSISKGGTNPSQEYRIGIGWGGMQRVELKCTHKGTVYSQNTKPSNVVSPLHSPLLMLSFQFIARMSRMELKRQQQKGGHCKEYGGCWSYDRTSKFIKLNILVFMTTEHASSQKQWMARQWPFAGLRRELASCGNRWQNTSWSGVS